MVNYGESKGSYKDYYYKYKALKYYLKNNSIKKQIKGGMGIDELIENTAPISTISELPTDIEEINCRKGNPGCIKCRVCGDESGTLRVINHFFNCIYSQKITSYGPFTHGTYEYGKSLNKDISVAVLQREYGIINKDCEKTIIGTYGAGPCIILCMRNINDTKTILAHIDTLTLNPLNMFLQFKPEESDVYLIGGDMSSKDLVHNILIQLKNHKYKIKFAHIIDSNSNSFAINCITGEIFINYDINPIEDLPLVYNTLERQNRMMRVYIQKSELNYFIIK